MTPLEIDILLWYHHRATDYRDGDFSAPAVRATIDAFSGSLGLLAPNDVRQGRDLRSYLVTERARVYVEHLLAVPLPECRWEIPVT